jgi:hypothetical protein
MSLSSFTLSSSSELSLCSLSDKNLTTISPSQSLSSLNSSSFHSSSQISSSNHILLLGPAMILKRKGTNSGHRNTSLQYSKLRGRNNEHGIFVFMAENRRICYG